MNFDAARDMDENMDEEDAFRVAVTRFVNEVGGTAGGDNAGVGVVEATWHAIENYHDLAETAKHQQERIDELESTISKIRDVGEVKSSKEEKIAAFVTYAEQSRDAGQRGVSITPKVMAGVAGIRTRYAYELIDELHEDDRFPWAKDARKVERRADQKEPNKALLIDFHAAEDGVHENAEPLNKFNNADGGQGASA